MAFCPDCFLEPYDETKESGFGRKADMRGGLSELGEAAPEPTGMKVSKRVGCLPSGISIMQCFKWKTEHYSDQLCSRPTQKEPS